MRASQVLFLLLVTASAAPAADPELNWIAPLGMERGTEHEMILLGKRLDDAAEMLMYRPGVTVTGLTVESADRIKLNVTVAPDAPLGEHPVRLRTRSGITRLATFYIGPLPRQSDTEPNNDFANPQVIPLGSSVHGIIKNEDVDYFAVEAKAGQRISVEVEALRLGRTMFDPSVSIFDERRFELAASDDSSLLLQDSVASLIAPADGRYVIQVREAAYGGCDACVYRLHVGTFPRPLVAYPPGARTGSETELTLLGDPGGPISLTKAAPSEAGVLPLLVSDQEDIAPAALAWRVADMPTVLEESPPQEPPAVPVAFHGVIAAAGEEDVLRFALQEGQPYVASVYARRIKSPLDPLIVVSREGGQGSVNNDDSVGLDSHLDFTAQSAGVGLLRIRDRLNRGGELFVYRVEIDHPRPALELRLPLMNSRAPQYRQTLPVPAGNRNAQLVRVTRARIGGPVEIELPELPEGFEAVIPPIAADTDSTPLLIRAAADQESSGGLYELNGRIRAEGGDVTGGFRQDVPLVIAPPNQTVYYRTEVDRLAIAATEPAPFRINLAVPSVPIVRGGTMRLKITAERAEGFDGEIECRLLWNPPGIASAQTAKIAKGATETQLAIQARGNAALTTRPLCIIARGNDGTGEQWVSSEIVDLKIEEPYVGGKIEMAAITQGQQTDLVVTLNQQRPFEGEAQLELYNLPAGTSSEPRPVTKDQQQIVFPVTAKEDARPGTYKNLFCRLVITHNDAPITHLFGQGGTLRVDKPPPPETAAATPAPAPAPQPQAKPAAKPLSRLQQLREQAKARRQQEGT